MREGFFSDLGSTSRVSETHLPQCGACGLYKKCSSPKMPVDGEGRKGVLIVGEAPGKNEDREGRPFVGESGNLLRSTLSRLGVDPRRDCWLTNAAICRPPNNKLPDKAIGYCRPNLIRAIRELKPKTIIPLGLSAVRSLLGWLWREDVGPIGRWLGWKIPCQKLNAWICPTWHPSYLLREEGRLGEVAQRLFASHLRAAFAKEDRPWLDEVPDYLSKVEVLFDEKPVIKALQAFQQGERPIAFDYETNMLKPDGDKARIASCAVSDGCRTISYLWRGKVIRETQKLLRSPLPKIASNLKFEERWTRKAFGRGVRNWHWDTMLAAHVLDSRRGITSVKFQAFVLLGQEPWDVAVSPYLKSKLDGGNEENRVWHADPSALLLYGGMDALLEWKVAKIQQRLLKRNEATHV